MTPRVRVDARARRGSAARAALLASSLVLATLVSLLWPGEARAYPWMLRHGYTECLPCHADPSGSGPLTAYGRAQGDLLLRTPYGKTTEEAKPTNAFLWGVIPVPEALRLGGDFRKGYLVTKQSGGPPDRRDILMRMDAYGDLKLGRLRVEGSLGYAPTGAFGASLTRSPTDNLVSRDHWIGAELDEDGAWLVRAGRMALPFGIRNVEHTLWARSLTRTDLNAAQQYGLALAFHVASFRGEVMGIAGNFEVRPDDYRERGYSAYVEMAPLSNLAFGASSLFTRARRDIYLRVTDYRQAHGLFVRYAPIAPLVLLAEGDWVYQSFTWNGHRGGYAAYVQADWEALQGVHFMVTGEAMNGGAPQEPSSFGGWLSAAWFFAPHADVRLDDVVQRFGTPAGDIDALSLLLQLHLYL